MGRRAAPPLTHQPPLDTQKTQYPRAPDLFCALANWNSGSRGEGKKGRGGEKGSVGTGASEGMGRTGDEGGEEWCLGSRMEGRGKTHRGEGEQQHH